MLCSIVWAGCNAALVFAQNPSQALAKLHDASGHWPRLPFDDLAAEAYGEIRAHLQRAGHLIGGNDLLIAAIAQTNSMTLVTHNTDEFTLVSNLPVEDW